MFFCDELAQEQKSLTSKGGEMNTRFRLFHWVSKHPLKEVKASGVIDSADI